MILEGIVTTRNADGGINLAPMGPRITLDEAGRPDFTTFLLRPFPSSLTYANLARDRQGVLHIVDDVLLLARAAVSNDFPLPPLRPATHVEGAVLVDCCRYFEFVVDEIDDSSDRAAITARTRHTGHVRDFFGLNRGKHAVVEAAILATRRHLIDPTEIEEAFARLAPLIEKTGGPAEEQAFALLVDFVRGGVGAWERVRGGEPADDVCEGES